MPGPWHLIEAGVATAARYAGMTEAPQALIAQFGALASPAKHVRIPFVPRETYLRAAREACMTLCDTVSATLGDGGRPLILGGECSIVAGSVPGAYATIPELILVYLDAHGDFNTLATTPSHFFGGMCLAHVCGSPVGPLLWPGVRTFPEDQVCLVGARDLDPGERGNLERSQVRRFSFDAATADPPGLLAAVRRRPIFVHVDLDVVDPAEMCAVNFPAPGGVSFASLTLVLASLARVAQVQAVEVCGYDPRLDLEGEPVRDIAKAISALLS